LSESALITDPQNKNTHNNNDPPQTVGYQAWGQYTYAHLPDGLAEGPAPNGCRDDAAMLPQRCRNDCVVLLRRRIYKTTRNI
jgi:hypothetical protein